ncbi:MAG: flagellar export chaperone FliS [Burkholderiales bacterium]
MYAANSAITAYSNTGMETGVFSADPHKLILLLFEGASLAISSALGHMARNEVAQKGRSISHAIAIINKGLQASLDMKAGGEIAQNLFDLYDYMTRRLLHANLNNDPDALREVLMLLGELKGAWETIGDKTPAAPETKPVVERRAALSYGKA